MTQHITLPCGAIIDECDLELVSKYNWATTNHSRKGHPDRKYVSAFINGKPEYLHRFLLGLSPGDGKYADHINRDPLDNRRSNLRIVTPSENQWNRRPKVNGNPFKGITYDKRRRTWTARIIKNWEQHVLGCFDTPKEAAIAYDKAAMTLFGEFALTNEKLGLLKDRE